jgi:serine/threonine protein phosphatase PrpC
LREDGIWVLVVCDGMGGHDGGEVASQIAADTLLKCLQDCDNSEPAEKLMQAIVAANAAVVAEGLTDMGTTAVVAWVDGLKLWYGWVGDSRLYQLRGSERRTITVDHTRVQSLVDLGLLQPEAVYGHPEGHILMQALGGGSGAQAAFSPSVRPDPVELEPGDVVFLSSDGLHDLVEEVALPLLVSGQSPEQATEKLVQAALAAGGYDNITVALMVVGQERARELEPEVIQKLQERLKIRPEPERVLPVWLPIGLGLLLGAIVGLILGAFLIVW